MMKREAELEELEKQWREQNDAIMREFQRIDDVNAPTPKSGPAEPGAPSEQGADESAAATAQPETHAVPPRDGRHDRRNADHRE